MKHKSFRGSDTRNFIWEVELDDDQAVELEFKVSYSYYSGCPSRSYYDPPDEPSLEILSVELLTIQVGDLDPRSPTVKEKEVCEKRFEKHIDDNFDRYFEELVQDAEDSEQAAYDDYWETKYDEMREEGRI